MIRLRFGIIFSLGALVISAQASRDYERKITEFTLTNGLHFIVYERHQLPLVSFHTMIDAGSAQDPAGQSGLAHLLEHMAFAGTESIGTKDWPAEKKAIDNAEAIFDQYMAERDKGPRGSTARVTELEARL